MQKARMAEDAWNGRDPERVSLAYTVDSTWRNRADSFRDLDDRAVSPANGLDYRLIKEIWASEEAYRDFDLRTNTCPEAGSAPTETKTGSSMSSA
jgi:nuclear transport factor 2 (NTF2) superfamily protein